VDYNFHFQNMVRIETRQDKLGAVKNTGWEGQGEVYFHVQSSEVVAPAYVG
jgi:hypothetical protein